MSAKRLLRVVWEDHWTTDNWVADTDPQPMMVTSIGYVAGKSKTTLVLAQGFDEDGNWLNLNGILRKCIVKLDEIDLGEES